MKFGESLSGTCPKLYNCFTNDANSARTAPLVKLIEAVMPCLVCLLTSYLWAGISMRWGLVMLSQCITFATLALANSMAFVGTD